MLISKEEQNRLRNKFNPDGSALRKAQMRMLEMLIFFDEICNKYGLTYWLDSGTLLGAVRHGGFLPWDDDVDVVMPRKDAQKLAKILKKDLLHKAFVLQCHSKDPYHIVFWDKIRDTQSSNVAHSFIQDKLKYKGLQIDIFRVDDRVSVKLKQKVTKLYHHLLLMPSIQNKGRYMYLRPLIPLSYIIMNVFIYLCMKVSLFKKKNDFYSYDYGLPWERDYRKKDIFPLRKIRFEGILFSSPNNIDGYLTEAYGNWRRLPEDNEVINHRVQLEFYF